MYFLLLNCRVKFNVSLLENRAINVLIGYKQIALSSSHL